TGSMGRVGAAGDNAAMESFFSLLQKNVLNRGTWATRDELRSAIVAWIERTYHRRRRQARLGRLTPIEDETIMNKQVPLAASPIWYLNRRQTLDNLRRTIGQALHYCDSSIVAVSQTYPEHFTNGVSWPAQRIFFLEPIRVLNIQRNLRSDRFRDNPSLIRRVF